MSYYEDSTPAPDSTAPPPVMVDGSMSMTFQKGSNVCGSTLQEQIKGSIAVASSRASGTTVEKDDVTLTEVSGCAPLTGRRLVEEAKRTVKYTIQVASVKAQAQMSKSIQQNSKVFTDTFTVDLMKTANVEVTGVANQVNTITPLPDVKCSAFKDCGMWALKPDAGAIVGNDQKTCCDQVCRAFNCGTGWSKNPDNDFSLGAHRSGCCHQEGM